MGRGAKELGDEHQPHARPGPHGQRLLRRHERLPAGARGRPPAAVGLHLGLRSVHEAPPLAGVGGRGRLPAGAVRAIAGIPGERHHQRGPQAQPRAVRSLHGHREPPHALHEKERDAQGPDHLRGQPGIQRASADLPRPADLQPPHGPVSVLLVAPHAAGPVQALRGDLEPHRDDPRHRHDLPVSVRDRGAGHADGGTLHDPAHAGLLRQDRKLVQRDRQLGGRRQRDRHQQILPGPRGGLLREPRTEPRRRRRKQRQRLRSGIRAAAADLLVGTTDAIEGERERGASSGPRRDILRRCANDGANPTTKATTTTTHHPR
mmetsp:Transcript_20804/g.49209  ORF Transcript_20804/g.49209 Transcript_20804/m.49209 type:complete len:319 (-) Transcript_20804:261-1217(-)